MRSSTDKQRRELLAILDQLRPSAVESVYERALELLAESRELVARSQSPENYKK